MNHQPDPLRRTHFLRYGLTLLLLLCQLLALGQDIPPRPNPPRLVNDLAGILNSEERGRLESKLRAYNDSTSTQIVILIVKTTEPYPIGDYSFQVGRAWGVGQKDKNNGLVLTWATDDRKVYIATGYGLEGAVPDAIAKRIISQIIVPNFKNEQWFTGLDEATDEIIKRLNGEYQSEGTESADSEGSPLGFLIILFVVILIIYFISRRGGGGGTRYRRPGGIFPFPYTTFSGWGGSSGNWGGGGSGGFGGFGGGSFGGGGAGGDY